MLRFFIAFIVLFAPQWAIAKQPQPPKEVIEAATQISDWAGFDRSRAKTISHWQAKGVFYQAHISGSLTPDWVIDTSKVDHAAYCGTGGCVLRILSQDAAGQWHIVFDRQVLGLEFIKQDQGPDALKVELHGVYCGGTGGQACSETYIWQGKLDRMGLDFSVGLMPDTRTFSHEGIKYLPLTSAVTHPIGFGHQQNAAAWPLKAREPLLKLRNICKERGHKLDESTPFLSALPDMNGDGAPEIMFDGRSAACYYVSDPEMDGISFSDIDQSELIFSVFISQRERDGSISYVPLPIDDQPLLGIRVSTEGRLELLKLLDMGGGVRHFYTVKVSI